LNGITAESVQDLARKLGYDVQEKNITPFELFNADEVFFTGTAAEIVPVREINKRRINDGTPGPVTRRLMEEFTRIVRDPKNGIRV
jgi:branched-chain amino acid aminotransferase